jgi:class 3 adenylate cyclase/tetratricopeptide (TPR) repeat protein
VDPERVAFAMSFLDTVARAKTYLHEHGRVSLRALQREFELDDDALDELVEELVDVQQVAALESKVLSWIGAARAEASAPDRETQATHEASSEPAAAASPAEAERRQLTVLFCDLVGSTDLSQQLDAEDWRNVVRAYQEAAAAVVARYEGHVAQYLGDGLLVYFGYPAAHEDDAERAVRAGREIPITLEGVNERLEKQYGVRLAVRVGVHTGPVVIGGMGEGGRREALALGDTTNIAARLEGIAEPDTVVISGATLRLVPGLFVTRDLGTPKLKGIVDPIRIYRVLQAAGVRSRLEETARLTPLFGREQELGLLLDRWEQAEEGEGHAVLITGEAGVGKSRLLHALRERLDATPHTWLECRCSAYMRSSAFHPVIELVQQGLSFREEDPEDVRLGRLEAGLRVTGLSPRELLPLIAPLLSLPVPDRYRAPAASPDLPRRQTIDALVAWILALGERQPLVLLFEDLHWCDPATLEMLGLVLEQLPTSKVLALLAFRPDFEPPWPGRSHLTPISLGRLRRRRVEQMIDAMAGGRRLPGAVVERLVERAGGVPLYVEELTKMVLESGLLVEREGHLELTGDLAELAIPATLQDSLMARLDRLSAAKEVAQLCAALGRQFSHELVASVAELDEPTLQQGLARLVEAELLYQRGAGPAATYTFKHALIQETAYQSLLRSVRQPLHARIARVIEERFPQRAASEPELLAYHFEGAGLAAEATGYYQRAGEAAAQRSAHEEASRHFGHGLELLAPLPEGEARRRELKLQLGLGSCLLAQKGYSHDDTARTYERARVLCADIDDAPLRSQAMAGLAGYAITRPQLDTAADLSRQLVEIGTQEADGPIVVSGHALWAIALAYQGELSSALEHFERAIEIYDPSHTPRLISLGQEMGVMAHSYLGPVLWQLGYPDRALERSERAVERARRVDHPFSLAAVLFVSAWLHLERRERGPALERSEELVALTERQGFPFYLGIGKIVRAWALAEPSHLNESIEEFREGIRICAETGTQVGGGVWFGYGAEIYRAAGQHERALRALGAAFTLRERNGEHLWAAALYRLKGEILLDMGGPGEAEAEPLIARALEIARSQQARSFELRAATSLARLWQRQGKRAEARDLLQPVYDWFTEGFDTQDLKDAKALLEELA